MRCGTSEAALYDISSDEEGVFGGVGNRFGASRGPGCGESF